MARVSSDMWRSRTPPFGVRCWSARHRTVFFFRLSRAVKAKAIVVGCLRVACAAGFRNAGVLVFGTLLSCCRACNTAKHRGQ